mmetsp:Transcript_26023/g.98028  ORF Transcript_26023/g.98028 Transcript_26023/m.98028 type:complete len:739 (+) Transcript_26023:359-2575(+)
MGSAACHCPATPKVSEWHPISFIVAPATPLDDTTSCVHSARLRCASLSARDRPGARTASHRACAAAAGDPAVASLRNFAVSSTAVGCAWLVSDRCISSSAANPSRFLCVRSAARCVVTASLRAHSSASAASHAANSSIGGRASAKEGACPAPRPVPAAAARLCARVSASAASHTLLEEFIAATTSTGSPSADAESNMGTRSTPSARLAASMACESRLPVSAGGAPANAHPAPARSEWRRGTWSGRPGHGSSASQSPRRALPPRGVAGTGAAHHGAQPRRLRPARCGIQPSESKGGGGHADSGTRAPPGITCDHRGVPASAKASLAFSAAAASAASCAAVSFDGDWASAAVLAAAMSWILGARDLAGQCHVPAAAPSWWLGTASGAATRPRSKRVPARHSPSRTDAPSMLFSERRPRHSAARWDTADRASDEGEPRPAPSRLERRSVPALERRPLAACRSQEASAMSGSIGATKSLASTAERSADPAAASACSRPGSASMAWAMVLTAARSCAATPAHRGGSGALRPSHLASSLCVPQPPKREQAARLRRGSMSWYSCPLPPGTGEHAKLMTERMASSWWCTATCQRAAVSAAAARSEAASSLRSANPGSGAAPVAIGKRTRIDPFEPPLAGANAWVSGWASNSEAARTAAAAAARPPRELGHTASACERPLAKWHSSKAGVPNADDRLAATLGLAARAVADPSSAATAQLRARSRPATPIETAGKSAVLHPTPPRWRL